MFPNPKQKPDTGSRSHGLGPVWECHHGVMAREQCPSGTAVGCLSVVARQDELFPSASFSRPPSPASRGLPRQPVAQGGVGNVSVRPKRRGPSGKWSLTCQASSRPRTVDRGPAGDRLGRWPRPCQLAGPTLTQLNYLQRHTDVGVKDARARAF